MEPISGEGQTGKVLAGQNGRGCANLGGKGVSSRIDKERRAAGSVPVSGGLCQLTQSGGASDKRAFNCCRSSVLQEDNSECAVPSDDASHREGRQRRIKNRTKGLQYCLRELGD